MRAFRLRAYASAESAPLSLVELPDLAPGPGQVRIDVSVCAACRTDLHVVEGELPLRILPITPGHQIVGRVAALGSGVHGLAVGTRVGVAWLYGTCGTCQFCLRGAENLCEQAQFTGYTQNGGFAEQMLARAEFVYRLPDGYADADAAPLLCAGIIGYRALARTGITEWAGARVGIYGFGAAGHIACQILRARGAEVYVATREAVHRSLAEELGARWVGSTFDAPPRPLDAGVVFAPAGEIVPHALAHLDRGGHLVLGGIHMSDLPALPYALLYGERSVCSVANNTRADGQAFLDEAARIGLRIHVERFPFEATNEALQALKGRGVRGAALVEIGARDTLSP
jgi:propanol-preferring alcohol dehydrogenase